MIRRRLWGLTLTFFLQRRETGGLAIFRKRMCCLIVIAYGSIAMPYLYGVVLVRIFAS